MDIDALINQITSLQIGLDAIEQSIERSGDPGGALKLVHDALREMIKALKSLLEQGPDGQDWRGEAERTNGAGGGQRAEVAESAAGPGVEVVIGSIGHLIGGIIGGVIGTAAAAQDEPVAAEEFPGKWVDGSHYKVDGKCFRVEWLAIDGMIKARVRPVACAELA